MGNRGGESGGLSSCRANRTYRPHTLSPDELLAAHLSPQLAPVQAALEAQLAETQERNAQLAETLRQQRDEVDRIIGAIQAGLADIEGANAVLDEAVDAPGPDGGSLRTEARELRADLAAVDGEAKL